MNEDPTHLLSDLVHLAHLLDTAVLDSALPAPSGENAGICRANPKSKSPCSDSLGDMRRAALDIIQPWAGNLSSDLTIGGVPHGVTELEPWCRWLNRHRTDLVARHWWPDAEEELRNHVHRPLADQLAPPLTTRENLPTGTLPPRLTEQEICDAYGITAASFRQWRYRDRDGTRIRATGATKRVLVKGEAEHHRLFERADGAPWPTRKDTP